MEQISRLGDIPSEIGVKPNQTNIQVDYECIGSLNDSNQLQIYSLVHKKVIQIIPDVQNYIFVKTAISDKSMLVTSNETTIKLYSFSDYYPPDSLEFNPKNKVAPFFDNIKTDHLFAQLCEFETEFKIVKLIPSDFNTILLLDEQSNLRRYNFYLDGVYNAGKFDSFSCIQFAFSGLYLAGLSSTEVHFWSANLEHLSSIQFQGSTICSLSTSLFAVCNGEEINVFDATNGSKTKTIQAINPTVNPTFVSFYGEDSAICTPEGTVIARKSHFLPIFVSGSGLYTINEEKYFLRLINVFPITVALSMIQSQKNNNTSNHSIAQYAVKLQDANLVESYLNSSDPQNTLQFLEDLTDILKNTSNITFALSINSIVTTYCIQKISSTIYPDQFSNSLCNFRNLLYPRLPIDAPPQETQQQIPIKKIRDAELLSYVLDNLEKNTITTSLPSLQNSYHDFEPFYLFRTLVLQQSWSKICQNNINESIKLIEQLGENPLDHLYEMWRQTTRNKTRSYLYEYLNKNGRLNELDEKHHQILLKITQKYPTTSFKVAQKLSSSPGVRVIDDNKLPAWQPIIDLNSDFDEKKAMIFPSLFKIPDEPIIESPRYFLGNIALIEAQPENIIKMLTNEGSSIEKLWILHCEHRVNDMAQFFKNEIDKNKGNNTTKLKCLKFINKYHSQMNTYELETLLDILCQSGIFAQHELEDFELLLVRICKNKFLFDQQWWSQSTLNLTTFFKQFASFCAKKSLFMPFEMFVISHPNTKEIDISDINEPLIKFIWDLWVKRDPANATLSCMQFIAKSNSTDLVELWKHLPNDSLAPLGSFVWNKDPEKYYSTSTNN
ncbi:hypothetical protein GPJ56_007330 [Histomonas meleagridis]|uniref:uncharacterized protein n=1 Tax=Histomonas meleagridis TaxID=135588 RepID=UPI00355A7611|nr:hypothetical protein GPJ56_007330 [Histomonas meleagridis]KAH0804176.1 hypothetical protein GO595_003006 [Histomonas meleagridis]